jgi:hypothetical protein
MYPPVYVAHDFAHLKYWQNCAGALVIWVPLQKL